MTTLLLIRHGETDAAGKVLAGWMPGWHLNTVGRMQVQRLAQRLSRRRVRSVYTSPLERTLETAEIIAAELGLTPRIADDLGEMRVGAWEGRLISELDEMDEWRTYNAHRASARPPGGELLAEVQARMVREVDHLREKHPGETVAVVSHGDPLRSLLCHCLGVPLDLISRFEVFPGSVSVVESAAWGPRVLCLNETGALPV
jgi:probable phosphomutase (TIGR03848 family)